MVNRKNLVDKYALISVFNKNKLKYLCSNLIKNNYGLISTGSTGDKIRSMGINCTDIFKITKFKEMFDGRIKTLNPMIYSSLLHVRDNKNHRKQFLSLKVPRIDIVVVNLYPFEKYYKNKKYGKIIEMIDIGGPSLLRAAGKNFKFVTPILGEEDYPELINNIEKNRGNTDLKFRRKMAQKVFRETSKYDKLIAKWFNEIKK
ncbi:hypothetical protein OA960_02500 [Pelagibacteraceae bacterium]|nr:hypothetical protein [Pelagibacteraceae bacterium]